MAAEPTASDLLPHMGHGGRRSRFDVPSDADGLNRRARSTAPTPESRANAPGHGFRRLLPF